MEILKEYLEKFIKYDSGEEISKFANYSFLKDRLPIFECSDKTLEEIYYFRAYTLMKHIRKDRNGKYIVTEFSVPVSWAEDTEGAISCAVGHHLAELGWISGMENIVKEYIEFWFEHKENLLLYNNWFAYAVYRYALLRGEMDYAYSVVDKLIKCFEELEKRHRAQCGLYKSVDNYDGMEYSISASGIRCTINSYVYANAYAIYKILAYKSDVRAEKYCRFSKKLKTRINCKLFKNDFYYNAELSRGETLNLFNREFSNPNADKSVKEEAGFIPFYFKIAGKKQLSALRFLTDETVFSLPFGIATADCRHEQFMRENGHMCLWNGPVWPFATSQTLRGVIETIRKYESVSPVGAKDFCEMLQTYANSQYIVIDGVKRPWIDENLDGRTGEWLARKIMKETGNPGAERGKDYNHSTFLDLVIGGLCGAGTERGKVKFKPLISEDITSFSLKNLRIAGKTYELTYSSGKFCVTEK